LFVKIIITEEQSLYLRRRNKEIYDLVKYAIEYVDATEYNYPDYLEEIAWQVFGRMSSDDRKEQNIKDILEYVRENYGEEIKSYHTKANR